jgi:hypothetical protein
VYFDGSLPPPPKSSVNEVNRVADRVRTMMGLEKSKEAIVTGDEPRVAVLEQRS